MTSSVNKLNEAHLPHILIATLRRLPLSYPPFVSRFSLMYTITALNIYPVKSCRGISMSRAMLTDTGFAFDREWLIVLDDGRFVTQREEPRLALIEPRIFNERLQLHAPGMDALAVDAKTENAIEVTCWADRCAAFDAGRDAAEWLASFLGKRYRLVRFDTRRKRPSSRTWTGDVEALNKFSDGYPWLVISQASLDDLNARLVRPLPMNRFRPNIVLDGLPAYGEDRAHEFMKDGIRLRAVKPCTRCIITTTDQSSATRESDEPLRTLRSYRFSRELRGVLFGQNLILIEGVGRELRVGDALDVAWKSA